MGLKKTSDGRYVVGLGVTDGNDYKVGIGKRDMVIQYTEDGATEQSLEYLEFLKEYALTHADEGKLIFPEGVSVWLATGDKLQAIEADDIKLTEDTFSVGSVSCSLSDGEWTFDAPSAGGSIPTPEAEDVGKVLTATAKQVAVIPEQSGESIDLSALYGVQARGFEVTGANNDFFDNASLNDKIAGHYVVEDSPYEVEMTATFYTSGVAIVFTDTNNFYSVMHTFPDNKTYATAPGVLGSVFSVSATVSSDTEVTASWQTASGGFSPLIVKASGECTYDPGDSSTPAYWSVGIDTGVFDIGTAFYAGTPVLFQFPEFSTSAPYYNEDTISAQILLPFLDSYSVSSHNDMISYGLERGGSFFNPTITMWYSVQPQI